MSGRGGTYCNFRKGATGKSSGHMMYISRPSAVLDRENGVLLRNMPEEVREAHDYDELRTNLSSYAWAREEAEVAGHKSRGEPRTHFRATLSFERDVESDRALRMTDEWLKGNFPEARAAAFLHRDTEHTHAHVWIDARQQDGRKVDLAPREYRRLDEEWNRIYSREMGRDEREHLQKKEETREYKRARAQGEDREKPERADRKSREMYKEREQRNAGAYAYDKDGAGRDQSEVAGAGTPVANGEHELTRAEQALDRATDEALRAVSEIAGLR